MNRLDAFLDFLKKAPVDPLSRPLLRFADDVIYDVAELHRGVLILGSQGEGKTTSLRSIIGAMMLAGFGGVALVVKNDFPEEIISIAKAAGRDKDVVVLRPGGVHRFNPFSGVEDTTYAAEMLAEISDGLGSQKPDGDDGWRQQRDMLLENLCVACLHLHGRMDADLLSSLYDMIPENTAGLETPAFKESPLARLRREAIAGDLPSHIVAAAHFLCVKFPGYPDRTQGSVRSMVLPVFHAFSRPGIASIFRGDSTVDMDEVLNHRKILLVDIPATTREGKCANATLQYCFCKASLRLKRINDAFLICDEFQETAGRTLIESLSLFRQYRVSPVLASQSVTAVELRVGAVAGKTIAGLIRTVVFFGQNDTDTNEWAEKLVGDTYYWKQSYSNSDGKRSNSETKELRPKVRRDTFRRLKPLHSICTRKGEYWRARWPLKPRLKTLPVEIPG